MKRILILMIFLLSIAACESSNQGYGYNSRPSQNEKQQINTSSDVADQETKQMDIFERAAQRQKNNHMTLRGLDGKALSSCTVYKGEWDGHTWYVFYDNLASPCVVHDPCCKCMESKTESYGD